MTVMMKLDVFKFSFFFVCRFTSLGDLGEPALNCASNLHLAGWWIILSNSAV